MSLQHQVLIQDDSRTVNEDQILTTLLGLNVEIIEVEKLKPGSFTVRVSEAEKTKLLGFGLLQIENVFLPLINPNPDTTDVKCPICNISIQSLSEEEKNNHVVACSNDSPGPSNMQFEDDTPFTMSCPYPNCGMKLEARQFPSHAIKKHAQGRQDISCPVCNICNGANYQVNPDTNLITHLQHSHADLLENVYPFMKLQPIKKPPVHKHHKLPVQHFQPPVQTYQPPVQTYQPPEPYYEPDQADDYIASYIKTDSNDECPICYELFSRGVVIARLPCLCVYHQTCIEAWFTKKDARICPLHMKD